MRFWLALLTLASYTWPKTVAADQAVFANEPPTSFQPSSSIKSTNLTDAVQWDGYSLFVQGQRIYLWSGEVHNWRVVVPDLYPDIMQRIKALGFNAISIYTFWGLVNPAPGVMDFEGWKDVRPFLEAANDAGLWVVARPGPYINAEVTGGGTPGWVTGLNVSLRTSDPDFTAAYEPYWKAAGEIFAEYQITKGGPIIGVQIENEYYLDRSFEGGLDLEYIQHLEKLMLEYGIVVPLTFNDVSQRYRLVTGKGAVDIYGADSYPQNRDCSTYEHWYPVMTSWRSYFQETAGVLGVPFYIPEFQGGWIPVLDTEGYEECISLYGSEFERVFYLSNIAQGIKMHNVYMVYGGTNYGHTAFPRGLTSYDYWAAISEDRTLKDKYYELKLISHFVRSSRDLAKTWVVASGDSGPTDAAPGTIQVDELRNPDTDAGYYVVRHANSSSLDQTSFNLKISDWQGETTVPVSLNGRDSRIIVTNYCWGATCVSHSSAAIMTSTSFGDIDVLVVYGVPGQSYEIAFPDTDFSYEQILGDSTFSSGAASGRTTLNFSIVAGDVSLLRTRGAERDLWLFVLDTAQANFAWETVIPNDGGFGSHYSIGSNETSLTIGPYLVRSAVKDGSTLALAGDLNATTKVYLAAASSYTSFSWNDVLIKPKSIIAGLWSFELPGPSDIPTAPEITGWKWKDSLPEITRGYDDSAWVSANKTSTPSANETYPSSSGKYVLYGQAYGFAVGNTIWLGHFVGTGNESAIDLTLAPGTDGAAAVWINGHYLGSTTSLNDEGLEDVNATFTLPAAAIIKGGDNVIQIVMDNVALEEYDESTAMSNDISSPRGIRGYTLLGGEEVTWKVQGNLGGWVDFPDKVRGIYNVGGLYGERQGWYLPGFDDREWQEGGPDVPLHAPGVRFYRAKVRVEYPAGLDVHYSFVFPNVTGGFRAQLYVNGWQFGRRYGEFGAGPQLVFPVPPGVLVHGDNEIALSFFALNDTAESLSIGGPLQIRVDKTVTTTTLELSTFKVDSPDYNDIFG